MTAFPIGVVDNAKPWTGQPDAQISYTANPNTTNNQTVYTFNNQSIGAADADRIVAVATYAPGVAGEFVSVTIGGISATAASSVWGSNVAMGVFYANVPTGTTATIVITCTDQASRCAAAVYRIIPGYGRLTTIDSAGGYTSSVGETEIVGGVSVWASVTPGSSAAYTVNRNGSALSTSVSGVFSGDSLFKSGYVSVSGTTNMQVDATYSSTSNNISIAAATWR